MKRIFIAIVGAGVLGVAGGLAIQAQAQSPGGGNGLGHHASNMAPGHPRDHGAMFGECISEMGRGDHEHMEGHMQSRMNGGVGAHMGR